MSVARKFLPIVVAFIAGAMLIPGASASERPGTGPVQVLAFGQSTDYVPPFIDAMDGIMIKGATWDPDPANWPHSTSITVKGAAYGISEARVMIRIEGKGDRSE